MYISIRKFLLINLLLIISIVMMLTVIGNFYLDQQDIKRTLDENLVLDAEFAIAFLGNNFDEKHLEQIQIGFNNSPRKLRCLQKRLPKSFTLPEIYEHTPIQIWSNDGKLLLYAPSDAKVNFSKVEKGLSEVTQNGKRWRTYATTFSPHNHKLVIAYSVDVQSKILFRFTSDDFIILLFTLPLAALLIWVVIGKAIASLEKIAKEVRNRAPSYLEPVETKGVPHEIRPVIDELNLLFGRLKQAFDREKRFAADAAHELRTPLAALKTQAQVALKTHDEEERKLVLKNLIKGVNRSTHIVQQLLTMSRLVPESPHIQNQESVNLGALCSEITAQLVPYAIEKDIEIELQCEKPVMMSGNSTALIILIRNLLDNAIRYTPPGGEVKLTVSSDEAGILLKVQDNGPGIPHELTARVFERFFRVLGNKTTGSGLGLAIVKQVATLHNANIQLLQVTEGTGLIVEIRFPKSTML